MAKIPDNVKKAMGKNKEKEKALAQIGEAMSQGPSPEDAKKQAEERSNNEG